MKWLILLALPLMSACDGDKTPDQPMPPVQPKVDSPASDVATPVLNEPERPVEMSGRDVEVDVDVGPVAGGDSEKLPSERVVPPPARPKPVATSAPRKKVEQVALPEPELDLSLPEDWSEALEPDEEPPSMTLLPPLFESSSDSRSLQMSGELLPGAAQDETIIDGAQINFEIKR